MTLYGQEQQTNLSDATVTVLRLGPGENSNTMGLSTCSHRSKENKKIITQVLQEPCSVCFPSDGMSSLFAQIRSTRFSQANQAVNWIAHYDYALYHLHPWVS